MLLDRLRGMRHIEWLLIAVAAAAVVLMMGGETEEPDAQATAIERRMESVLSCVEGAGRVRVLVRSEEAIPAFSQADGAGGVIVVAEGADDLKVRMALQQAVQAFLGIDAAQIEVLDMEEDS